MAPAVFKTVVGAQAAEVCSIRTLSATFSIRGFADSGDLLL